MQNTQKFRYVTIIFHTDYIKIELNEDGRNLISELNEWGDTSLFYELLEDALGNGWQWFKGDQIDGWFTQCDILSEDSYYDDNGDVILSGNVYTNINWYQIRSNIDKLLSDECVFHKVS